MPTAHHHHWSHDYTLIKHHDYKHDGYDHNHDEPTHHHHGPNSDILIHDHVGSADHDHYLMDDNNDEHPDDFYANYGPAVHNHDEPAVEHDIYGNPVYDEPAVEHYYVELHDKPAAAKFSDLRDNIVIHPKPTDESTSVDWADDIDTLTGNDPYNHLPSAVYDLTPYDTPYDNS